MTSQITSLTIVYSTVYSGADQRKHQRSTSLAFVRWMHRWPVNSLHKGLIKRKMFPFDDVIMIQRFLEDRHLTVLMPKSSVDIFNGFAFVPKFIWVFTLVSKGPHYHNIYWVNTMQVNQIIVPWEMWLWFPNFQHNFEIYILIIQSNITQLWIPDNLFNDKLTLV